MLENNTGVETLKAWKPYHIALRAFYKLHNLDSPGDFEDWDIYWLAAITATRAVWHRLNKDISKHPIGKDILKDYNSGPATWKVYQEFTKGQRDRTLKNWLWDIATNEVTLNRFLSSEHLGKLNTLVFRYWPDENGKNDVPEGLQGEDPLRLLGIALRFLHRDLSVIEESLKRGIKFPFSETDYEKMYVESNFFNQYPDFYR